MLTKKERPERSKIKIEDAQQAKCWAHRLGVSREDLRKVGTGEVGKLTLLWRLKY
jgi:Protein of unknown function (DUF3606)